jgi:small basic protein
MLVADAVGIIVGIVLGKRIPERIIKWFSAIIFIGFGVIGLYQTLPKFLLTFPIIAGFVGMAALLAYLVVRMSGASKKIKDSRNIELAP